MISAFGVDHGEVSKAFGFSALGTAMGRGLGQAGRRVQGFGGNMASQRGGAAVGAAGRGMRKAGVAMRRRPGLTGGLAAGGAGVGAGSAAGAYGNRRRF